ncbi:PAQR family membrane homeostasis protein TrhA [Salinicoccus halitifaciens]|uniref:Hemolysin III n=1 Tax=Salinicoccus halitifaciens TaxID=1073415 RepID=A0ABV2E9Y7_9STAP|nr:hemolysin III family protein [Salinicoccus halitifaciens]MCD2138358.1 hemolysin III family protein [Salinicoccus halitifaciens]
MAKNDGTVKAYNEKAHKSTMRHMIPLSFGEEVGNSVSHGVAAIIFIMLLPFTSVYMYLEGGTAHAVGGSIYVISILFMFLTSTLYHSVPHNTRHKYIMRLLDHSLIYVAIAGTYTPIAISVIGGFWGTFTLIIQWTAAVGGILYKVLSPKVSSRVSMIFYLLMGWMAVLFAPLIISETNWVFISLIALGGISYTVGAWFYSQKERKYFHMIWHFFIIAASAMHYVAIVFYI